MPSVMNIHLLRQPYENMNAMAVFCKYSTPARIIFKTLRDAALIPRMLSRRKTVFTKLGVNHSHSQSAAVRAEITVRALNLIFILRYLNRGALPGAAWQTSILCATGGTSYFLTEWHYMTVSQFHCHAMMSAECCCTAPSCQFVCRLTSHRHRTLRSLSVADRMSRHLHSSLMAAFFDPTCRA